MDQPKYSGWIRSGVTAGDLNRQTSENFEELSRAMPESPDFEQIARRLIVLIDFEAEDYVPADDLDRKAVANELAKVVEQLRLVWNARGAVDIAVADDGIDEDDLVRNFHARWIRAIRNLDR